MNTEAKLNEALQSIIALWARLNAISNASGAVVLSSGRIRKKGTATVVTATTSIAVTHGAGITPLVQDIFITLNNSPTNAIGVPWVDTIGATTFKINCANPGASGATFGWTVFLA